MPEKAAQAYHCGMVQHGTSAGRFEECRKIWYFRAYRVAYLRTAKSRKRPT